MANDINKAISANQIKNGTTVVTTTVAGEYSTIDTYAKNSPTINDIQAKYDNRFYNGIFVNVIASGI
jgi:hypothetical protein